MTKSKEINHLPIFPGSDPSQIQCFSLRVFDVGGSFLVARQRRGALCAALHFWQRSKAPCPDLPGSLEAGVLVRGETGWGKQTKGFFHEDGLLSVRIVPCFADERVALACESESIGIQK